MSATIDQNLTPNAIVEFHAAKNAGSSDGEAWAAAVARIRYDVLQMAITTLALNDIDTDVGGSSPRERCIQELIALQKA